MTDAQDIPQERMSEYGRLFAHALTGRERTGAGLMFRFEARPGVEEWVRDLSRREAACCPFFNYIIRITGGGDVAWLIATDGDPVAEAILDEMYRLPDVVADGFPRPAAPTRQRRTDHQLLTRRSGDLGVLSRRSGLTTKCNEM